MSQVEVGFRAAVLAIGVTLIGASIAVHTLVGPKHRGTDFGAGTGLLTSALFVFGVMCIIVSTDGTTT